jgi:hypothetical protein
MALQCRVSAEIVIYIGSGSKSLTVIFPTLTYDLVLISFRYHSPSISRPKDTAGSFPFLWRNFSLTWLSYSGLQSGSGSVTDATSDVALHRSFHLCKCWMSIHLGQKLLVCSHRCTGKCKSSLTILLSTLNPKPHCQDFSVKIECSLVGRDEYSLVAGVEYSRWSRWLSYRTVVTKPQHIKLYGIWNL